MASPPTDIVIACCRDEADIIGSFISFYVDQGFDAICLVDNGSRDDTVREIKRHPARDRIRLHCDPRVGYDGRLMEYNRLFSPLASRWIFFLDVDEFIVIPGGIKTYAEQLPLDCSILEMATFEMIPDTATVAPEPLLAVRREGQLTGERKVVGEGWHPPTDLLRKTCHRKRSGQALSGPRAVHPAFPHSFSAAVSLQASEPGGNRGHSFQQC